MSERVTVEMDCFIELDHEQEVIGDGGGDGEFDYSVATVLGSGSSPFTNEIRLSTATRITAIAIFGVPIITLMRPFYSETVSALLFTLSFWSDVVACHGALVTSSHSHHFRLRTIAAGRGSEIVASADVALKAGVLIH